MIRRGINAPFTTRQLAARSALSARNARETDIENLNVPLKNKSAPDLRPGPH
jgi:hypothetical protein